MIILFYLYILNCQHLNEIRLLALYICYSRELNVLSAQII